MLHNQNWGPLDNNDNHERASIEHVFIFFVCVLFSFYNYVLVLLGGNNFCYRNTPMTRMKSTIAGALSEELGAYSVLFNMFVY